MIPPILARAAEEHGWSIHPRGRFRGTISRGGQDVEYVYDLYRHTRGRAYRGNRLTGVFRAQREIVAFLAL